jgi:hypothetical protein
MLMISGVKTRVAVHVQDEIVPIVWVNVPEGPATHVEFCGTGFVLPGHVLVTCWHCVNAVKGSGGAYLTVSDGRWYRLEDIEQDHDGYDLATARVPIEPTFGHVLGEHEELLGTPVSSFGYPFSSVVRGDNGDFAFKKEVRLLRGYIARGFLFDHISYRPTVSYELDMRVPSGLSGAPLIFEGTKEIIGVVYGVNKVSMIEEVASVDSETGEKSPEIHRIETFGLAHHTSTLRNIRGKATGGERLCDYVARRTRQ